MKKRYLGISLTILIFSGCTPEISNMIENTTNILTTDTVKKPIPPKKIEEIYLNNSNIILVYESRATNPVKNKKIVKYISKAHYDANDEFEKREILNKELKNLPNKLAKFKKHLKYEIRTISNIGEYDFDTKSFPIDFSNNNFLTSSSDYMRYGDEYVIKFTNANTISNIPIALEEAKRISQERLQRSRNIRIELKAKFVRIDKEEIRYSMKKVIYLKIYEVAIVSLNGHSKHPLEIYRAVVK
jgi:hypothetical protein